MNNVPPVNNPDSQVLLNQIVLDFMREQKRKRVWRWIKRFILLAVLIVCYFKIMDWTDEDDKESRKPHVGLIDLKGTIFDTESASADNFAKGLESAYKKSGLKALVIRINSPGGSPVQADYMYNTLQYYRKTNPEIKVYAVCVDLCASAAYYVASAADEIYANESSMIGSIGVVYSGFGFVEAMQKLGVSRRLQTSGSNKAFLDPFSPVPPQAQQLLQGMLNDVHQEFINKVKTGRGARLKVGPETFSGLLWTGTQALPLGLIDGFASTGQLARDKLKLDTIIEYTFKQSMFERVSRGVGTALAGGIPQALGISSGIKAQVQ